MKTNGKVIEELWKVIIGKRFIPYQLHVTYSVNVRENPLFL